jgi:hypothetical protein
MHLQQATVIPAQAKHAVGPLFQQNRISCSPLSVQPFVWVINMTHCKQMVQTSTNQSHILTNRRPMFVHWPRALMLVFPRHPKSLKLQHRGRMTKKSLLSTLVISTVGLGSKAFLNFLSADVTVVGLPRLLEKLDSSRDRKSKGILTS